MSESAESPASVEPDPEGGDPVCWLHLVCESCGALLEHEGDQHRPGCMPSAPSEPVPCALSKFHPQSAPFCASADRSAVVEAIEIGTPDVSSDGVRDT